MIENFTTTPYLSIYDVQDALIRGDFVIVIEDRTVSLLSEGGESVKIGNIVTVVNAETI